MLASILIFLSVFSISFADEEAFKDRDGDFEIDRVEYNITDENKPIDFKSENIMDIQSIFKFNGQYQINNDFTSIKEPKVDAETNGNINDANKKIEGLENLELQFESRIKLNLYDDIRFDIPVAVSYLTSYPEDAISKLGNYDKRLSRILDIKIGFWIDWFAMPYFKIGLRGGQDDHTGNAFILENKLYSDKSETHESGFDVTDWDMLMFGEFRFEATNWMRIEPEARLGIKKGYKAIGTGDDSNLIFYVKALIPVKMDYKIADDLRVKGKLAVIGDKGFSGESSKDEKRYGTDAGYGLNAKAACELEYKIISVAKLRVPLKADYKHRFAADEDKFGVFVPNIKVNTEPNVEIDFALFKNVYFVADVALDYDFFKATFGDETSYDFLTSPTLKYGVGFRYDSSY